MSPRILILGLVLALAPLAARAAAPAASPAAKGAEPEPLTLAEQAALLAKLSPALVRVEYTLQYDKGEAPESGGYHRYSVGGQYVEEERPLEVAGFLLAEDRVLTTDLQIHPRFIKSIAVRAGAELVEAQISAFVLDQGALLLQLSKPIRKSQPLAFDAAKPAPYLAVMSAEVDGRWMAALHPLVPAVAVTEDGRQYFDVPSGCLIVNREGVPIGIAMKSELPPDDTWKGSPLKWPTLTTAEMAQKLATLSSRVDEGLLRVRLNFRSPKKDAPEARGYGGESLTELDLLGVQVDERQVLVLVQLSQELTARLERATVFPAQGEGLPAKFAGTLADYGGLLVTLETPRPKAAIALAAADPFTFRDVLLLTVEIAIRGEHRSVYLHQDRISSFSLGWQRHLYPEGVSGSQDRAALVFTLAGELVALPISRRDPAASMDEYSWRSGRVETTSGFYLKDALAKLDASNIPRGENEEAWLAWLGIVLQPLNQELARMRNVTEETRDGSTGALISYVYPDSPAAAAGVKPDWIMLRLRVKDRPKPIELQVRDSGGIYGSEGFPWERLDELPDRLFDRLPPPWPPASDALTGLLTELGAGKEYTVEFIADGQLVTRDFKVVESPPHYDAAPRFKSEPLGLTVRDITYELRRYFQMKPEDPGVILSNIKPGSKASVAGLKPYEIVTQVNGTVVKNVKEFEPLVAGQTELRFAVRRMTRERQVKITIDPNAATATPPSGSPMSEWGEQDPDEVPPMEGPE